MTTKIVHTLKIPFFNISMFTEKEGSTIVNNEDRKKNWIRKNAKMFSIL